MPQSAPPLSAPTPSSAGPRVAVLGVHLEANRLARQTTKADFEAECWVEGDRISEMAGRTSNLPLEVPGFYNRMNETGPWVPVPIIIAAAQPGGPIVQAVFDEFLQKVEDGLKRSLPLDAVYVCSHGGSLATEDDDNDGTLVVRVRAIVGPDVPVVVTHDLHCSVSDRMVEATDALLAYRTNPHVDHRECAAEAADLLRLMMGGVRTQKAFIRLPIQPPGVTMLTAEGPFADLVKLGVSLQKPPILNVSVTGGFAMTDAAKCGITINVTSAGDQPAAQRVARQIAQAAWDDRHRYHRELMSVEQAVALARQAASGEIAPIVLADVADNPGGGAPGTTTWLMKALHDAGIPDVVLGLYTDRAVAAQAQEAGVGARIPVVFNREEDRFSRRFECTAEVEHVSDGFDVGRRGRDAGRQINLGRSALLRLEGSGLRVVVTTLREQPADPRTLEMFGIDIARAKCVVLKSRGHFRAGFDEFFAPAQIHEVDAPGITTNVLRSFAFQRLTRPIWPLDEETAWSLPPAA
ncbi:M81 family metallopeptidase [Hydrogenophaga sp.]|uniref:M81 family metallopeptidase n=1 Tax=Hydrogenophaga sp. TaxID=1904254 RepID=UPI00271F87C6|nr:M81 family metallopeptidase [Hydrogenophaga sp.]MDO9435718.1 M81 family metallopeptidase [Hydrogenophaga sp.]